MLPRPADWRWLDDCDDSPWYPTLRLFRQSERNHWEDVVVGLKSAMQEWASSFSTGHSTFGDANWSHSPIARASSPSPAIGMAASRFGSVAETRYGIMHYLPQNLLYGNSVRYCGEYLQTQLDALLQLIVRDAVIVEAGSGIGFHTLALCSAVGENGHVFAYEHDATHRSLLRQNLDANHARNCTLMRRRLGRVSEADQEAGSLNDGQDTIDCETIDDLQLARLDWLKLGEGVSAVGVLRGAEATFWRLRPKLMATVSTHEEFREIEGVVREVSYRCWMLETSFTNPMNFYHRDNEALLNRTILTMIAIPAEFEVGTLPNGYVEVVET
jgi:precorrin-6B methylase 2